MHEFFVNATPQQIKDEVHRVRDILGTSIVISPVMRKSYQMFRLKIFLPWQRRLAINSCHVYYGHHVKNGVIKLSLLRAPAYPGEKADQGAHKFRYALYPHADNFEHSDVVDKAYQYNNSVYNCTAENLLACSGDGCVVECFKRSENGAGVIVRICEEKGRPAVFTLKLGFEYSGAYTATIDERIIALESLEISLKPFEIVTLLLEI